MTNIVAAPFLVLFCFFCFHSANAQVIQKQAHKNQLIEGKKLSPNKSNKNLIKVNPVSVVLSQEQSDQSITIDSNQKNKKPNKMIKHGNNMNRSSIIKREEDD